MGDLGLQVPLRDFAIALFIGALVGIEREKKQAGLDETERSEVDHGLGGERSEVDHGLGGERSEPHRGIGGLRTFILFAQAGALGAWLSQRLGTPWIFLGTGALVTAAVIAGYLSYTRAHRASFGLTTEVAAVVVYLLGGTVVFGDAALAVALAIVTSAVLAFKEPLHGAVERLGRDDIYAGLKLLLATFIVLPVLPDRTVDPWDAINPYHMWWLVILISGLSLVGYAATRWLGAGRGTALAGLFGGLVSSTAVTLSFARRSREEDAGAGALAAGILVSWAIMFARVLALVGAIDAALLSALLVPMALLGAICAAFAGAIWLRDETSRAAPEPEVPLRNPFSLTAAVRFAALFAAVLLVVKITERYAPGSSGVYGVAALAGLTDVDAITLSMAESAGGSIQIGVAANAIVIAAASNTLVKCGLVAALGAPALRRRVALATAALALCAAGSLALR